MRLFMFGALLGIVILSMACSNGGTTVATASPTSQPASPVATSAPPTVEGIIAALTKAGLPIDDSIALTAETDSNNLLGRPGQYVGKGFWHDTRFPKGVRLSADSGGTVELFKTPEDMTNRKAYVDAIAKTPLFAEYSYGNGRILLRLPKVMTPEQAAQYESALMQMRY